MITAAFLKLVGLLLDVITAPLPEDTLDMGAIGTVGALFAQYTGPANAFLPMYELGQFLVIFFGVWLPSALVYTVAKWIYRHLPLIGKG